MEQTLVKPPVTKPVLSSKEIDKEATDQLQDLYCDLRVELDPKLAALKIHQKELADVEKQLLEALDAEYPASETGIRKTAKYLLSLSAKGKALEVTDKKKLIALLGLDTFLAIAEVGVEDMRKYLTEKQLAEVTKDNHKNKRRLTYAAVG